MVLLVIIIIIMSCTAIYIYVQCMCMSSQFYLVSSELELFNPQIRIPSDSVESTETVPLVRRLTTPHRLGNDFACVL